MIRVIITFILLMGLPTPSNADGLYFQCADHTKWKYEKGLFGGKVYNDRDGKWVLMKNTEIHEDKLIIKHRKAGNHFGLTTF